MARALISPRTMAALRALDERAMPDTATLERPGAPASNGRGGVTPGAPTTFTSPCRILDGAGDERDDDGLYVAGADARLICPVATDVGEGDTVTALRRDGVSVVGRWNVFHAPPATAFQSSRVVGIRKG